MRQILTILAVIALVVLAATPTFAQQNVEPSTWGSLKARFGDEDQRPERGGLDPLAVSVNWNSNTVSEAYYALCQYRTGTSHAVYQGLAMGDWDYPHSDINALNRVTALNGYGSPLGTWRGYRQGGPCKFFVNLVLYRSSYGYPGGHLFLPSGYTYGNRSWREAQPGWVIQSPGPLNHTAIVVANFGWGLDVIDSNWIGGDGSYVIGRHTISAATLDSWGFRGYVPWQNPRIVS